jgi:hypothetical protein
VEVKQCPAVTKTVPVLVAGNTVWIKNGELWGANSLRNFVISRQFWVTLMATFFWVPLIPY